METNNLIEQVINHAHQPTVSEQSARPSGAVMDRLWERMLENYGHRWEGSYGDNSDRRLVVSPGGSDTADDQARIGKDGHNC